MQILKIMFCPLIITFALHSTLSSANAGVNFSGKLINVPCKIDNNKDIDVNFGDSVDINEIDGLKYTELLTLSIKCDENYSENLYFRVSGSAATFDKAAIRTNITNVGIKFINGKDGTPLEINKKYNYVQTGDFSLKVVPVKKSGSIPLPGKLTISAQLIVEPQ